VADGERPAVHELLDRRSRRRICLVIGAAGWGKSTVVRAWTRRRPCAWVGGLDHDGDPVRFTAALVEALRPHVPAPPPRMDTGVAPHGRAFVLGVRDRLAVWLRRSLPEEIVLVIDDLQDLPAEGETARLVEGLCRNLPDRLHLVLLSRREPPFSLERLRGRGLVDEIRATELALNVAEIAALLDPIVDGPPSLATRIREQTDGWPAAVNAAVTALRGIDPAQRTEALETVAQPGGHFHRYLREEVVDPESAPIRELLRRLAVIGDTYSTANLAPGNDAVGLLADLARRGLVRRSAGEVVHWSLVVPLRDYFDHHSVLTAGDRAALHLSAAQECLAQQAWPAALTHLRAAGRHADCAALLVEHGEALVDSGQVDAVLQACDLPGDYLDDPAIQRVLGHAQQVRGQWAAARECFLRAGHDQDKLEPALAWRVATLALSQGELAEVISVSERTHYAGEDTSAEARMLVLAATSKTMVGDTAGLREITGLAVDAAKRCRQPVVWSGVHHLMAMSAAADGDHRLAAMYSQRALHNAETADDLLQVLWVRAARAFHLLNTGSPRRALAEARVVLQCSERCHNVFFLAHGLTTRGRAKVRLGWLEAGLADLTTAAEHFQRIDSRFLAWPLCGIGDVHRLRGHLVRARTAYEEALALARPCHEVFGLRSALVGLARTRAADDLETAAALADEAVQVRENYREVSALLARGWVSLLSGRRSAAVADAARASACARLHGDRPALAEAITLDVLASPGADRSLLAEAVAILHESGCRIEEAMTRLVAERAGAPLADLPVATRTLHQLGVELESKAAGQLAMPYPGASGVAIRALGGFEVIRDGAPVPKTAWRSKKARDLLMILVTRRRPVPREQLMELLWPGVPARTSTNRLSVLLSGVRDVLQSRRREGKPLASDAGAVWLDRDEVSVDVEEFLDRASAALDAHRAGAPDAIALLRAAETAYTGGFLENDPYQEWAEQLAEEVRATYVALLRALAAQLRDAGDIDGMARHTLRLLEHDPYNEDAHFQLITAMVDAGHLGEARRRYQIYVRRMAEFEVVPRPMPQLRRRDR